MKKKLTTKSIEINVDNDEKMHVLKHLLADKAFWSAPIEQDEQKDKDKKNDQDKSRKD